MGQMKPPRQTEKAETPRRGKRKPERMHPAGPHARPELTDHDATPGTGALPDLTKDRDVDPGVD